MNDQKCRVCGCTEDTACTTPGGPCFWVERDLCSACAQPMPPGSILRYQDMKTLEACAPIPFSLPGPAAFMLLSLIQLALRHPDLEANEMVVQFGCFFGEQLQEKISLTENLRAMCRAGWPARPTQEETQSPIVLPPGYGQ